MLQVKIRQRYDHRLPVAGDALGQIFANRTCEMTVIPLQQSRIGHGEGEILTAALAFHPENEVRAGRQNILRFCLKALIEEMHPEPAWVCPSLVGTDSYRLSV